MNGSRALTRAVVNQRRPMLLAAALAVAGLWITVPLGRWPLGLFFAVGSVLGLLNYLATEVALKRTVESAEPLSRTQFATSAFFRLIGVSLVAGVLTIVFWPDGAASLFGLALFRLIALVLTGLPLLRELKKAA